MIRRYRTGDEIWIGQIFHRAIQQLASADYMPEQLEAWSANRRNMEDWTQRCEAKRPFVKEVDGRVVGFIELDPDGLALPLYIRRQGLFVPAAAVEEKAAAGTARALGVTRSFDAPIVGQVDLWPGLALLQAKEPAALAQAEPPVSIQGYSQHVFLHRMPVSGWPADVGRRPQMELIGFGAKGKLVPRGGAVVSRRPL